MSDGPRQSLGERLIQWPVFCRMAARVTTGLPHSECCERAQQDLYTSAMGSKPEFAAQETNGCYPANVGFHTLPQTTPICASE
jgi:hypothetical protein